MDVVVIYTNDERRAFQEQQFSDLNLPYNVMYFPGYTPATSKDYITDYDEQSKELDTTICCFRSHIGAMRHFIHNSHADYCMIIEDDVALLRSGFQKSINHILYSWKPHSEIDYIVVGRILSDKPHKFACRSDVFEWQPQEQVVWGLQAYIVRRDSAARIVSRFDKPNTSAIREDVWAEVKRIGYKPPYDRKHPCIQSDALIPGFFIAAYSKELLGLETPFTSMISNTPITSRWINHILSGRVDPSKYYGNHWANIVVESRTNDTS
jgi:hypothetical protein